MKRHDLLLIKDIAYGTFNTAAGGTETLVAGDNIFEDNTAGSKLATGAFVITDKTGKVLSIADQLQDAKESFFIVVGDPVGHKAIEIPVNAASVSTRTPTKMAAAKFALTMAHTSFTALKAGMVAAINFFREKGWHGKREERFTIMYSVPADVTLDANGLTAIVNNLAAQLPKGFTSLWSGGVWTVTCPADEPWRMGIQDYTGLVVGDTVPRNINIFAQVASGFVETQRVTSGGTADYEFKQNYIMHRATDGFRNDPDENYAWADGAMAGEATFSKDCYYDQITVEYRPLNVNDATSSPIQDKQTVTLAIPRTFTGASLTALTNVDWAKVALKLKALANSQDVVVTP